MKLEKLRELDQLIVLSDAEAKHWKNLENTNKHDGNIMDARKAHDLKELSWDNKCKYLGMIIREGVYFVDFASKPPMMVVWYSDLRPREKAHHAPLHGLPIDIIRPKLENNADWSAWLAVGLLQRLNRSRQPDPRLDDLFRRGECKFTTGARCTNVIAVAAPRVEEPICVWIDSLGPELRCMAIDYLRGKIGDGA